MSDSSRPLASAGANERRLLQLTVALACIVPLAAGAAGILRGPEMLRGVGSDVPADLDSHFRYLSGLLFAIGLGFATCILGIERKTARFRLLAFLVFVGGLGRLCSLISIGMPGGGHVFGLAMELVAVPLLVLWQARVAGRPE
ncbi:MAG TPA: DUF4345 domain-containing protein [Allosphingosinicella sp.]|nr:DUF4345 domain-containing protein [Allosphingosinicella sp.]